MGDCATETAALRGLLEAEYAGRAFYAAAKDNSDREAPMGLAAANQCLTGHAILGAWKEDGRGRSADSSLAYCVGVLSDANRHGSHAYVQIWQYDPKSANWGLRILLINPLAPSMSK